MRVALLAMTVFFVSAVPAAAVSPSQVLVLYNADWTDDEALTDPGQDSKEVAEHYVLTHTDPVTGEKPSTLGLRCVHRRGHLDGAHLTEDSHDNESGVVLRRQGKVVGPAGELRDSRAVEFVLPGGAEAWRVHTLRLDLMPARGEAVRAIEGGRGSLPGVLVQAAGDWNVRLDGRSAAVGPFVAQAECEDRNGETQRWRAEYQDYLDVECSRTGADGVRDDQNYLEDVERPVKAFLEDPRNARPDGTLLKDHVLFFVVSYGLPRSAAASFGIARGINDRLRDHGADIDFGQRLQLLYYDVEGALGFSPRAHRFEGEGGFTDFLFRAPQAWPLWGEEANPFVHRLAYRKDKGDLAGLAEPLAFTPENRTKSPGRHLYFSMRVDAADPLGSMALADRAAYATRYGGPELGGVVQQGGKRQGNSAVAALLGAGGYRHFRVPSGSRRLQFLRLEPGAPFLHRSPVFLPGGISGTVTSTNGWNRPDADLYDDLVRGVTVTAAAARVYEGAPHIHDKSWWDDEILYPFLLRGRTIGECLLMNQVHLEWVTSFIGDPLYRLPERHEPDREAPTVERGGVRLVESTGQDGTKRILVAAALGGVPARPEVAQLRLWAPGEDDPVEAVAFDARPCVVFERHGAVEDGAWRIEVVDPAGHRTVWSGRPGTRE